MRYLLLVAVVLVVGCEDKRTAVVVPPAATIGVNIEALEKEKQKKTYTRDEFKKLVVGKTKAEIEKAVRQPDEKPESTILDTWSYKDSTYDPALKNYDRIATIRFKDGVAESVEFF